MIILTKKMKRLLFVLLPTLLLIIGGSVTVLTILNRDNPAEVVDDLNNTYTQRKVYLVSSKKLVTPLTIKYIAKEDQATDILFVINLLKKDSIIANANFNGLLSKEVKVNHIELENNALKVDFDAKFSDYAAADEIKLLESLTYTLTDLVDVRNLVLSVDGQILKNMPNGNTPIPSVLNKTIGINRYALTNTKAHEGTQVLSYYSQIIDKKEYLVPVTHFIKNTTNLNKYDLAISTLIQKPNITSDLKVVSYLKDIKIEEISTVADSIVSVNLNEKALQDENSIKAEVYEIIRMVFANFEEVLDVQFIYDEEVIPVSGYNIANEPVAVNSFIYNSIKI